MENQRFIHVPEEQVKFKVSVGESYASLILSKTTSFIALSNIIDYM
jgi:hypothetical protein